MRDHHNRPITRNEDSPILRPATDQDAAQLAVLMDIASRGLVSWYWTTLASDGRSSMEVGERRIRERKDIPSHLSSWTIAESKSRIVGAFAGYVIPEPYDPGDVTELPEVYAPLLKLESCIAGSWFLMALSVYPEFRRKGFGSVMLREAMSQATKSAAPRIALTVSSKNDGALALYSRTGFKETRRERCIPYPGSVDDGEWVLLTKDVSP